MAPRSTSPCSGLGGGLSGGKKSQPAACAKRGERARPRPRGSAGAHEASTGEHEQEEEHEHREDAGQLDGGAGVWRAGRDSLHPVRHGVHGDGVDEHRGGNEPNIQQRQMPLAQDDNAQHDDQHGPEVHVLHGVPLAERAPARHEVGGGVDLLRPQAQGELEEPEAQLLRGCGGGGNGERGVRVRSVGRPGARGRPGQTEAGQRRGT
eukprot:scaffold15215_cov103-Isochrysis_galbana.AAC.9